MMKKQPAQWLLSAASVGIAGIILTQSYGTAVAETNTGSFVQTPEQKVTTRQVAALLVVFSSYVPSYLKLVILFVL